MSLSIHWALAKSVPTTACDSEDHRIYASENLIACLLHKLEFGDETVPRPIIVSHHLLRDRFEFEHKLH